MAPSARTEACAPCRMWSPGGPPATLTEWEQYVDLRRLGATVVAIIGRREGAALWILLVTAYGDDARHPSATGGWAARATSHITCSQQEDDNLQRRRRPQRRVRGPRVRELVPAGAQDGRASRRQQAGAAAQHRLRPADRPRLRRIGGARAVPSGEMLALLAFAFVLAAAWHGGWCRSPWATAAPALVGALSPPTLAAATTVTPGVPAAVLLTGAALWRSPCGTGRGCARLRRRAPARRAALAWAGRSWRRASSSRRRS